MSGVQFFQRQIRTLVRLVVYDDKFVVKHVDSVNRALKSDFSVPYIERYGQNLAFSDFRFKETRTELRAFLHPIQIFDKVRAFRFYAIQQSSRIRFFKQHAEIVFFHRFEEICVRFFVKVRVVAYLAVSHVFEKPFENEVQYRSVFRAFEFAVLSPSERQNVIEIVRIRTTVESFQSAHARGRSEIRPVLLLYAFGHLHGIVDSLLVRITDKLVCACINVEIFCVRSSRRDVAKHFVEARSFRAEHVRRLFDVVFRFCVFTACERKVFDVYSLDFKRFAVLLEHILQLEHNG